MTAVSIFTNSLQGVFQGVSVLWQILQRRDGHIKNDVFCRFLKRGAKPDTARLRDDKCFHFSDFLQDIYIEGDVTPTAFGRLYERRLTRNDVQEAVS